MSQHASTAPVVNRHLPPPVKVPWHDRAFLPLKTAAEILGVSAASVYRLETEGKLTFSRIAGRTLVQTAKLIALIESAEDWAPSDRGAAARAKRTERARAGWE